MKYLKAKTISATLILTLTASVTHAFTPRPPIVYSTFDPNDPTQKDYVTSRGPYTYESEFFISNENPDSNYFGTTNPILTNLEWVPWDATTGFSLDQALSTYSGFRLASENEVHTLLGSYIFYDPNFPEEDGWGYRRFLQDFGASFTTYHCLLSVSDNCTRDEYDTDAIGFSATAAYFQPDTYSNPGDTLGIALALVDLGPGSANPISITHRDYGDREFVVQSATRSMPIYGYALVRDIRSAVPEIDIAGIFGFYPL